MKMLFLIALLITSVACAKHSEAETEKVKNVCGPTLMDWFPKDNCDCYQQHKLVQTQDGAKCIDTEKGGDCSSTKNGYSFTLENLGKEAFASCFAFPGKQENNGDLYTPNYIIETQEANQAELKKLAAWADKNQTILSKLSSWPSPGLFGEFVVITQKPSDMMMESVFRPYQMSLTPVDYLTAPIAPKIFSSVDELTNFLSNPENKTDVSFENFNFDPRAQALIEAYKNNYLQGLKVEQSSSVDQCLASCRKGGKVFPVQGFQAQYREYRVANRIYRSEIILSDANQNILGFLYLADQRFSVLVLIDRNDLGLVTKEAAFSIAGEEIYAHHYPATDIHQLLQLRDELKSHHHEAIVGVCENNFNLNEFKKKGLLQNVAIGPNTQNSFFGWSDSDSNAKIYWLAQTYFNEVGLNYSYNNYAQHAMQVSETLLIGNGKNFIGIAPLGVETCLDLNDVTEFWPQVKSDDRLRVINVSTSDEIDEATCLASAKNHPMVKDPDVLWIVAAGNSGLNYPTTCPQFLTGADNVVMVGAAKNGSITSMSNKGRDFVDIAALGTSPSGDVGTSYAAPRVSALAADVFRAYPELTAHEVKIALLLGAKASKGWALDVRSEGEIHNARTLEYAKHLATGASVEETILKVECSTAEYECDRYHQKLKIYNQFK